jgi:hypothetical protein
MGLDDPDNPLAIEIRQESAATYFAACKKMVDALETLKAFDRTIAATPNKEQIMRRTDLLANAAERVYFVVIQREAMKLSSYDHFFEHYEVPDEVRTHLGPQRTK